MFTPAFYRALEAHRHSICAMLASLAACGCSGSQSVDRHIEENWQWDQGAEARDLMLKIGNQQGPARRSVVIGVTGIGLRGQTLPAGTVWEFEATLDVLPTIVGDRVLFTAQGRLFALDTTSGKTLFELDVSGRRLEGAGYDGQFFVLFLVDKDDAREDQVRVVTADGQEHTTFSSNLHLGTPAAVAGVGLVPYGRQYVGAFDLASGKWLGRVLYRDALHSVSASDQGVFLWGRGVTPLSESIIKNPDSQSLRLDVPAFPGDPAWPVDGSKPRAARGEPVALLAAPEQRDGELHFAHDVYVTTYYQIAVAQDTSTHEIKWVNHFERAVAGAAIGENSALLCLENGSIQRVGLSNGQSTQVSSLDARLKACAVTTADEPGSDLPAVDVRDQIVATITATGPDMAKVQTLLLDRLAKFRGTTRALLTIAQDPRASMELARYAGEKLGSRKEGGDEMVQVLRSYADERASRLSQASLADKDTSSPAARDSKNPDQGNLRATLRPPPVAPIAKSLLKQRTPGAAEALAHYLDDPSLTSAQIRTVMKTIAALGGAEAIDPVHRFVLNYKNTGGEPELIDALVQAVEFLFAHMDENGRAQLHAELNEPLTFSAFKKKAQAIKAAQPEPSAPTSPSTLKQATPPQKTPSDKPPTESRP